MIPKACHRFGFGIGIDGIERIAFLRCDTRKFSILRAFWPGGVSPGRLALVGEQAESMKRVVERMAELELAQSNLAKKCPQQTAIEYALMLIPPVQDAAGDYELAVVSAAPPPSSLQPEPDPAPTTQMIEITNEAASFDIALAVASEP